MTLRRDVAVASVVRRSRATTMPGTFLAVPFVTTFVKVLFAPTFFVSALFLSALFVAGLGSASFAGAATDAGAAVSSTSSTALHRNTVACDYVDWTYSGLFQHPLEGSKPSAFSRKVGGAASATLRREVSYWAAAKAYQNWAGVDEAGLAMVNTCDRLGISR